MPGLAGDKHLGFGGAALSRSLAARRIVCFISGMDAQRAFRGRVSVLAIILFLLGGSSLSAPSSRALASDPTPSDKKPFYLLHASLNEKTLEERAREEGADKLDPP